QWVLLTLGGNRLYEDPITTQQVLDLVARMKTLDFDPGADIIYSNTGYTLAAEMVKKKAGMSLRDFAQRNIFARLQMGQSSIAANQSQIPANSAKGYEADAPFKLYMPRLDVMGATNLFTTVDDLLRWDRNFENMTVGGNAISKMQVKMKYTKGPHPGSDAELGTDNF